MRNLPAGLHRTGVIGLGTGSLAAYGIPGDYYRFYEINSAEIPWTVAGEHCYFTFIRDSAVSDWVLLSRDPSVFSTSEIAQASTPLPSLTRCPCGRMTIVISSGSCVSLYK
jgi:hypothetical protein